MQSWIRNYERVRHSKQHNESWVSSKYDIEGIHWTDLQQIYLPELGMCFGPACSALRKSWRQYKIAGRNGEPRGDLAYRIVRIQRALGIPQSDFPELQGMEMDDEELTDEEVQLQIEEKQENGSRDWNLNFGTSEERSELYTDEWSKEDKQLHREEREVEKENDDWWFT